MGKCITYGVLSLLPLALTLGVAYGTSVLSSAGAGCDHMDHVITQLPYALTVGLIILVLYLII